MKTILIISNSGGGLIHFRKEVISALCANYKVIISIPDYQDKTPLIELGASVIGSPINSASERTSKNPFKELRLLCQYDQILRENKPDLVLTYTIKPNVYGGWACQRNAIPYIANVTGLGNTLENGGIISKISLALYKKGLKEAACIFFQNETNLKKFMDWGVINGKTRVIPGSGVNLASHPVTEYPKEDTPVRFLFMGRLMKDKGIEELLYAIKKVKEQGHDVHLDILGNYQEDYKKEVEEAEKTGVVQYHGHQSDVNSFISRSHCVVLPSYHEGMSNVMLEAASSGRPVITTNVPGCQETFDEGITGFGCEAKDKESLVEAMEKFIALPNDKRAEMGLQGRQKIEREFNRDIIVQAYLEEVRRLINQ